MSENLLDVDDLPAVVNISNQPELVAADIKYGLIPYEIDRTKRSFQFPWILPGRKLDSAGPTAQGALRSRKSLNELLDSIRRVLLFHRVDSVAGCRT